MAESLRDEQLGAGGETPIADLKYHEAPPYTPDEDAYQVDAANDPYAALSESLKTGATLELSLACADGRREKFELNEAETQAWFSAPLNDRLKFANGKIRERHARIAVAAAQRLRERGLIPSAKTLSPEEEACLREFDMLQDALAPLPDGGYDKVLRLSESAVDEGARRLREDGFWDGFGTDDAVGYGYAAPTQREYLPRGGPMGQQQMISDIWDSCAKAYYAWTHDPVARMACNLIADFVLGRGVQFIADDANVQTVIDEYVQRDRLPQRLHALVVSLVRDGNLYARKLPLGDGRLKMRELPTETIWEIVTDAEDTMDVYWYVQRYQTRYVLFATGVPAARARWVERTILAGDLIHVKINAKESDVFGRSDIFPALGWLKRLRDYFDAVIQKQYAAAAYQWHYKVNGGSGDLSRLSGQVIPSSRPQPGSYIMTNNLVDVEAIASGTSSSGVSGDGSAYEALLNHVALAFGLSKNYFGASSHENRASALVAQEPTAKHFESYQDILGDFLDELIGDVIAEAQRHGKLDGVSDLGFKCVFPSIIKADATVRTELLRKGEAMAYISKQTAAEAYAGEAELDDYDFEEEQSKIKAEIGQDPKGLIAHDMQMVKKGAPQPSDIAFDPSEVPNPDYAGAGDGVLPKPVPDDAGNHSPTSASGAAKIQHEIGRGGSQDSSTMESDRAFREYATQHGLIVIRP